jgi:uncharacterized phage protein (TIGR02220 family)
MPKPGGLQHIGLRMMKLALRVVGLTFIQRLVLAAIASHCDGNGQSSWPGEDLLAAETALGLRTVRKGVRGLEDLGIVKVTRRGRRLPNVYAIQVDALEAMPHVTGTTGQVTGTTDRMTGTTCRSPEAERPAPDDTVTGTTRQGDRHVVPPKGSRRAQGRAVPPISPNGGLDASAWLGVLNEVTGTEFKATDGNLRPIRARIREGFKLADARTVVEYLNRKWGRDPKMAEYRRPLTAFGTKFDSYLQAARNGHGHDRRRVNDEWPDVPAAGEGGR